MGEFTLIIIVAVILFLLIKNSNLLQDKESSTKEKNEALKKLCELGDAESCRKLAESYYPRGDDNADQYLYYLEKSCDLGDNLSCKWLGDFHKEGKYVSKDIAKSIFYYNKGVEFGNKPHYCENALGYMYFTGNGVKQDIAKAASLIKKACNDHSPTSCFSIFKERKNDLKDSQTLLDEFTKVHKCTYCPALAQLSSDLKK